MTEEEYKKQLDAYMKEQYSTFKPKPNGMYGHWGWYAVTKREFDKMLKDKGIKIIKSK